MMNTISVIVTVYNGESYVAEALDSVLSQDYNGPVELIVVDDGSVDGTTDIIRDYSASTLITQENSGQTYARNAGIRASRGDLIVFLDHDDLIAPGGLRRNATILERNPELASVGGAALPFRNILELPEPDTRSVSDDEILQWTFRSYESILLGNAFVPPSVCMFRRELVEKIGGFRHFRSAEDLDFYLRASKAAPMGAHDQIVSHYRRHGSNHSHDTERLLSATLEVLDLHLQDADSTEVRKAIEAGRRYWISQVGPGLPNRAFWLVKDMKIKDAAAAFALWCKLGMPRQARAERA